MIKILIAEDHQIVGNGIKPMLEKEADFKIVGEASNGLEALSLLKSGVRTDIILTDISMPEMDGMTLSNQLRSHYPDIKVIILSTMDHEKYIFDAFNLGIKGYLLKNITIEELVFSIRHVMAGYQLICAKLGMQMLNRAAKTEVTPNNSSYLNITAREREILLLTADGYTNNEIADKLFTSKRTVEGHRQSLIKKTGAKNTAALIKLAFRTGILK